MNDLPNFFTDKKEYTDGSEILATNGLIHSEMQRLIAEFYG